MMNVTVGMTAYDCLEYSKKTLKGLFEYATDHPFRLLIVDDGSTDGSREYFASLKLEDMPGQVRDFHYIEHQQNQGTSQSWNDVMNYAHDAGELAFIINNDIIPGKDWVTNMLGFINEKGVRNLYASYVIDILDQEFLWDKEKWFNHCQGISRSNWSKTDYGIHGCCMAITPECREIVGEFDTSFMHTSYEDCDYVVRCQKADVEPMVTYRSVMFHYGGVTQSYITETHQCKSSFQSKNRAIFEKKWGVSLAGTMCSRAAFWKKDEHGNNKMMQIA